MVIYSIASWGPVPPPRIALVESEQAAVPELSPVVSPKSSALPVDAKVTNSILESLMIIMHLVGDPHLSRS